MSESKIVKEEDRLILNALNHPDLYARKVSVLVKELELTKEQIESIVERHSEIITFTHAGELFIGLKERKSAYDEDTARGINPFEPNYRGDEYRKAILGGKPRF